jgi:hypothetical protein
VAVWISQTHYGVRLIAATGDQEDFVTTIVGLLVLVAYARVPRAAVVDAAIQSLDVKVESDDQVGGPSMSCCSWSHRPFGCPVLLL